MEFLSLKELKHNTKEIAKAVGRILTLRSFLPQETDLSLTTHKSLIDQDLTYEQPALPWIERTEAAQLRGGWDESGNYLTFVPGVPDETQV